MATGQRLLLVDVLLVVLGAHAMHQQAMVVHAIGRAGDERHLVGAGLDGQRLHLLGQHHLGVHHLVGERLVHGVQ